MEQKPSLKLLRFLGGSALVFAGVSHLTFARKAFQAQVPDWVPLPKDETVLLSGMAEIALGGSLLLTDDKHRPLIGQIVAAFLAAVFPGNLSQWIHRRRAFGLDTDGKRFARLFLQPLFIYLALKSTRDR